jgi:hypothetical protein
MQYLKSKLKRTTDTFKYEVNLKSIELKKFWSRLKLSSVFIPLLKSTYLTNFQIQDQVVFLGEYMSINMI